MLPGMSVFAFFCTIKPASAYVGYEKDLPSAHDIKHLFTSVIFCTLQNSVQDSCQVVRQKQSMLMKNKS